MSIGIDFVLRANSAGFTKGVASANNSLKDLKKSLREGDVGHGLKQLFGAGAIIAGFRAVINNAQEVRKSFEEMGKPIPDATANIAAMGDALDDLKKTAMSAGTSVLGFFTGVGAKLGDTINEWRREGGAQLVDPKLGNKIEKDMQEQEAARDEQLRKRRQRNTHEELKKASEQLNAELKKNDEDSLGALQQRNALLKDEARILTELAKLSSNPDVQKNDPAAIIAKRLELSKVEGQLNKADEKVSKRHDEFLPTVENLAASSEFGFKHIDPKKIAAARDIVDLENKAKGAGFSGNFSLADSLNSQAGRLRQGLAGSIQSSEVDKGKNAVDAIAEASDKQVGEIQNTNKLLAGLVGVK